MPLSQDCRIYLPMRNTLVAHLGQIPWVAGRLFFIVIALGYLNLFSAFHAICLHLDLLARKICL